MFRTSFYNRIVRNDAHLTDPRRWWAYLDLQFPHGVVELLRLLALLGRLLSFGLSHCQKMSTMSVTKNLGTDHCAREWVVTGVSLRAEWGLLDIKFWWVRMPRRLICCRLHGPPKLLKLVFTVTHDLFTTSPFVPRRLGDIFFVHCVRYFSLASPSRVRAHSAKSPWLRQISLARWWVALAPFNGESQADWHHDRSTTWVTRP